MSTDTPLVHLGDNDSTACVSSARDEKAENRLVGWVIMCGPLGFKSPLLKSHSVLGAAGERSTKKRNPPSDWVPTERQSKSRKVRAAIALFSFAAFCPQFKFESQELWLSGLCLVTECEQNRGVQEQRWLSKVSCITGP